MKKLTGNQIRQMWLDFFKSKDHYVFKSVSLIPKNDKTLLWINSGVASLKQYFDGTMMPPHPRITSSQKCIRTNDIENVGLTARHHTFFEMLGNFSIGNYFKKEAISFAFELMTSPKWFGFDLDRLYFTYYPDDLETKEIWMSLGVKENKLVPLTTNFWEIGEGPCGPNTEIIYDRGEKYDARGEIALRNDLETARYVELWNIVFSSFNAETGKKREEYKPLPHKNIDTGAGFERLCAIMQDVETNYDTDLFAPIMQAIAKETSHTYAGQKEFKIIADHLKTITFAVSDGAVVSNEGRGYVLRRLIRRAVKAGRRLGMQKPFIYRLVPSVIEAMVDFYTELAGSLKAVQNILKQEEEKFFETIEAGEKEFFKLIQNQKEISGENAFKLYDTYGFPFELTKEYADENQVKVDEKGFYAFLAKQKELSRSARQNFQSMKGQNKEFLEFTENSEFIGYENLTSVSKVIKVFKEGIVLDKTPFFAETGGQVSDLGTIDKAEVQGMIKLPFGQHLHVVENNFKVGQTVKCTVDESHRTPTMYNHSATHLIHRALKDVLGDYVNQRGSKVCAPYLRFDFNCYNFPKDDELLQAEKIVKEKIKKGLKVKYEYIDYDTALKHGAIALFGEKYDKTVRMVSMEDYSIELCGGTHVKNTSEIKDFAITQIESIGSGIYRIFAVSGDNIKDKVKEYCKHYFDEAETILKKINEQNNAGLKLEFSDKPQLEGSYQDILNSKKYLQDVKLQALKYEKEINEFNIKNALKSLNKATSQCFIFKSDIDFKIAKDVFMKYCNTQKIQNCIMLNSNGEKINIFVKSNTQKAVDYIKKINSILNSKGGGRPDFATAGGGDLDKIDLVIKEFSKNDSWNWSGF